LHPCRNRFGRRSVSNIIINLLFLPKRTAKAHKFYIITTYSILCYAWFACRIFMLFALYTDAHGHIAIIWCYSSDLHIYVIIIIFGRVFTLFPAFPRVFYLICRREGNEKKKFKLPVYLCSWCYESSLCVNLRIFLRAKILNYLPRF